MCVSKPVAASRLQPSTDGQHRNEAVPRPAAAGGVTLRPKSILPAIQVSRQVAGHRSSAFSPGSTHPGDRL